MSKHTPGSWIAERQIDLEGKALSMFDIWTNSDKPRYIGEIQREENARLIAAAPLMSDTLKRAAHILAELPDQSPQLIALRSQIVECIKQATPEYYSVTQAE